MAALLKNQILKHLSKFTKNLSADKLNLSAMKGCCEVHNIELNESVLMDLLELPLWMSLSRARCNHVSLRVQWMKLKTLPICLALDEVEVEIETCEHFRQTTPTSGSTAPIDSGKYGFTDKVFDGMTLTINSVVIRFKSKVFNASLQLSRLMIESRCPNWKRSADLRLTRIRDPNRGQILIFKHLEWQTLRFEAKAESNVMQTPLRLIANQASCRLTIKKKLKDCSVLGARIMFIFDDLLWVLTDAQLLSALHFADYLGQLIQRAPRTKHFDEMVVTSHSPTFSSLKNMSSTSAQTAQSAVSRLFSQYDIIETSHHIFVGRIEVHLCDDLDPNNGRSLHPSLKDGGALQITVTKLVIDIYPYQKVMSNRNHWLRYSDPSSTRNHWINQHLQSFFDKNLKAMSSQSTPPGVKPSVRTQSRSPLNQLMSRVVLIRLADYGVSCVTTNTTTKLKLNDKLIATDKSAPLPEDMMAFYMEINSYYYLDWNQSPPEATAFVHLAPLKVTFDALTLLWMNAFQANLHNAMVILQEMLPKQEKQKLMTRIECLMPLVCIKCPEYSEYSTFELKSARIVATNCETEATSFEQLDRLMEQMGSTPFMYERQSFPWLESDPKPISDEFFTNLSKLKSNENSDDIWTVRMEPLWAEFKNRKTNKFEPLVDPLPITLWAFETPPKTTKTSDKSEPDLSLLLCISSAVKVQLNHSQYLFLMRFLEQLSEFGVQMNSDTIFIQKTDQNSESDLFQSISLITAISNIELVLKLSQEFQTLRSIGLSPQHSVLDLSSPSIQDKYSIDSEMPTLVVDRNAIGFDAKPEPYDSAYIPKSHSDSLLSGSSISFETNQSAHRSETSNKRRDSGHSLQTASSLAAIPAHNKLQNASQVLFKKSPNSDVSSLKSNSTFNESGLTDGSIIDDDNRSIRSDLSADSDQFVVVGFETMTQEEEDIFATNRVETADEVREDSLVDSPSDADSNSNCASHSSLDTPLCITLLHIKVLDLNLVQYSKGFHSKIYVHCSNISVKEFIKMAFSEYQIFINQRIVNKTNEELTELNPNQNLSEVTVRLESYSKLDSKDELISVLVNNIDSTLHLDSVMLLTDFITDEEMAYVPPTNILLNNVCLTLIDDKVSTPPLALNIPHLFVMRDKSNQMNVLPLSRNHISSSRAQTEKLLTPHLQQIHRNEGTIGSSIGLRVSKINDSNDQNEVLDQILKKNETLLQEIERIKCENIELKAKLNIIRN